jgi:hypothetical protein
MFEMLPSVAFSILGIYAASISPVAMARQDLYRNSMAMSWRTFPPGSIRAKEMRLTSRLRFPRECNATASAMCHE